MFRLKPSYKYLKEKMPLLYMFYKWLFRLWKTVKYYSLIKKSKNLDELTVERIKNNEKPLKVLFFVIHESVWKLETVYKKMESDSDFHPIIVICPYINAGEDTMNRDMNKAFTYFNDNGYNVKKAIDENGGVINLKHDLKPDIIFFTNPHDLTFKEFQAENYLDVLSIYIPYSHQVSKYDDYQPQYNQLFHNLMWKIFTTNSLDKQIFKKYSERKGANVIATGYPGIEYLLESNRVVNDVWKRQGKVKKKIIYAPHHTIDDNCSLGYSTFLKYSAAMLDFVEEFSESVQFAFKPHPLLRDKLANDNVWGKEATDKYFDFWQSQENTQLEDGEYLDLFLQSDAIIHDSGSFLAEYLYVNKPCLYLLSNGKVALPYNPFGVLCLKVYDICYEKSEIESFILTVINGSDTSALARSKFIKEHLLTFEDDLVPSDLILKHLRNELIANKNV
ncbi:CDP-glycerol glycerophosphotransferase family protein [Shewanella sp. 10N.286.54.B9]|uniref:CDP-glycerol glycerophosphotransferase family protein n=1 Tax=Shewanella sp. 10N.286.54.B9 TaxID=3229719 RepID=UPI00355145CB